MAAVIQRNPRSLLGITAAGLSASVSYAVYNYFGAQVDPEILIHVENLIAELPTPTLPLEDVIPPSFSAAVQYYTPTFIKNAVSADFLANHDWCLYALTGVVVWATVSDTLLAVAYLAKHNRDEEITRERHQYEAVIEAQNKENGRLQDSLDAANTTIDAQASTLEQNKKQNAEDTKFRQGLEDKLDAARAQRQGDEATIKGLSKDLEEANTKSEEDAYTIAQQSTTIDHLEEKKAELVQTRTDLTGHIGSLEDEIVQRDGTITKLGQHNEDLTQKVNDLTNEVGLVSILNEQQSEKIAAFQHDNGELKKSVDRLEVQIDSLTTETSQQATTITQSQQRNEELEQTVTGLRGEILTLEAQKSSLESSSQANRDTITRQAAKIVELQQKEGQDKCTTKKLREQVRMLEDAKALTEASLATANARNTSLTGDLKKANAAKTKDNYEALDKRYKALQADTEQISTKYDSTIDGLNRKVNDLEGAVKKGDDTTAVQASTLLDLKSELKQKRGTIGNLQDENKVLKHDLKEKSITIEDLHHQNTTLQSECQQTAFTIVNLQSRTTALENNLNQSSITISNLEAQNTTLQNDLAAATTASKTDTPAEKDQRRADERKFGDIKTILGANATHSLRAELKSKEREIEDLKTSKNSLQEKLATKTTEFETLQRSEAQMVAGVKELEEMMDPVEESQQDVPAEGSQQGVLNKLSRKEKQGQRVKNFQDAKARASAEASSSSMEPTRAWHDNGASQQDLRDTLGDETEEEGGEQINFEDETDTPTSSTQSQQPDKIDKKKLRVRAYKKKKIAAAKAMRCNTNSTSSSSSSLNQRSN
ncbi:MAG: hypothetical protein Q9186_003808 [Xanthomendoza sp. 1 TL-2023]